MDPSSLIHSYMVSQHRMTQDKIYQGFVTISRQTGAGGISIAEKLAQYLNKRLPGSCPWMVFDKNLVEVIVKDHELSDNIIPYLKENAVSNIEDTLENILGLHPPHSVLMRRTNETIAKLAKLGRVILVGRGSAVITRNIIGGVHVRLIASLINRIARVKDYFKLDDKDAEQFIENEDQGRARYLKAYCGQDINDPFLYDFVINTDTITADDIALMISELLMRKLDSCNPVANLQMK